MFQLKKILICSVLTALVSACSTPPPKPAAYNKEQSMAMNVASAVYITDPEEGPIVDAEIRLPDQEISNPSNTLNNLALGGGVISSATNNPYPKMSNFGTLSFGFTNFFFSPNKIVHPAKYHQFAVWMPKDNFSEKEVVRELNNKIESSINSIFDNYLYDGEWKKEDLNKTLFQSYKEYTNVKTKDKFIVNIFISNPWDLPSPQWHNGTQSWVWKPQVPGQTSHSDIRKVNIDFYMYRRNLKEGERKFLSATEKNIAFSEYIGLTKQVFYQKLAKQLPEWVYIYTPPSKEENRPPMILNQDKAYFFVKPSVEKQASVTH